MKPKKSILIFIDWFLPGYKAGGPITSCANFIEALKGEYDFKVITRDRDYMSNSPYELEKDRWIKTSDCEVFYLSPSNLSRKGIKSIVKNLEVDAVYINGIFSWYFSILPLLIFKKNARLVAPRGMLRSSALKVKSTKKRIYLALAKLFGLYKNVVFHSTTLEESQDIRRFFKGSEIKLASNLPKLFDQQPLEEKDKKRGNLKICFPGRIAREKNLKYALEVVSCLKGKIEMNIAGELYDEPYWQECEELINKMPSNISTRTLGSLDPQKFRRQLEESDIALLPTLGENYGHAIIESLSLGSPVVISDQTPWKNLLSKKAGVDLSLKSKDKFVSSLQSFCDMDAEEYNRWSKSAKQYAMSEVDWNSSKDEYRNLFNE